MNKRFARLSLTVLVVLALALSFAGIALAFDSGNNPGATGPNTITWTGGGASNGVLNEEICPSNDVVPNGIDPNSYLHWIVTTDGGSADAVATLHLGTTAGGSELGTYPATKDSGGALHFFTPYFTPDTTTLFAYADINVLTTGNGPWNLNISHGCAGQTVKDLEVTKTANTAYTRTFNWTIDKSASPTTVYSAGGGQSDPTTFTINATKDAGHDSDFTVSGDISVYNPNSFAVTVNGVSDSLAGASVDCGNATYPYSLAGLGTLTCSYSASVADSSSGTNTATANWDTNKSNSGSVDYAFGDPTTLVNDSVHVTDSNGGSWDFSDSGSKSYDQTYADPAGTCTPHTNTATLTGDNEIVLGTDSATVSDCQGVDLTVSKTATPSFDLKYAWTINKSVDKTSVQIIGSGTSATFNYTVTVSHDAGTASNWKVNGTITVSNPNDWQDVTLDSLTDAIDNGGTCTVDTSGGLTIPTGGSKDFPYECTYASAPTPAAFTNTATATWDAATYHTSNGSDDGTASDAFGTPTSVTDDCVSVSDSYKGLLGTVCVGDANPTSFTYSRTVSAPALGTCVTYDNTATFTTNDTGTTDSASQTVTVCHYNATLTIGYWMTHMYKCGTKEKTGTNGCNTNGPFTSQFLPVSLGNYVVDTTTKALAVFNANNCSNASTSDANATGCLAAQLLAAKLNIKNSSNPSCISSTIAAADTFLISNVSPSYKGPGFAYILNTRAQAIALKTTLDTYNNFGCP